MFSMPEHVPVAGPSGSGAAVVDTEWARASTELAGLEARGRSLRARGRITAEDTRAARRAARRVLREHRTHLPHLQTEPAPMAPVVLASVPAPVVPVASTCESCRQVPAARRVVFIDGALFAVCPACASGAVAGVAA